MSNASEASGAIPSNVLMYLLIGVGVIFFVIVLIYLSLRKRMQSAEVKHIKELREGTKVSTFSSEIMYQKLYVYYLKMPFIKRYLMKVRRKLEIINIDDEYLTRKQASKILTRTFAILLPLTVVIIALTYSNYLLLCILLIFEIFMIDTFIDGSVDKIDNKLLKQQINFFSEIRHAYHEFNMVEEAIYQVAQDDEAPEMSRQAEKIYEVLISDDPEGELEKYYDVAPNSYLKEFAGVSYLTKEFGDRKVDGASLYLKNLNNITQEMQLEILKRDKLDYVFQSLSVISIVPMLGLEPIKNWAVSQFSFTEGFYMGKNGMLVQILILVMTFICYTLTRKLKDNGSTTINTKNTENPWQAKVYKIKPIKKFVDLFIPKQGTKEYRKLQQLMKDAASIFIGEHDFASFCSYDQYGNTIRELYKILIEDNNGIITFTIVGNGFRRYMVRHIVGGLIQVGAKRITKKRLQELLDSKGKEKCLFKAKPQGLYLYEVFYD